MRIMFKHILFLISLLAFLGAIQAYGGIEEDLDAQLKELAELNKPSSVARAPAKLDPPTPLPEKEKAPVLSEEEEEELVEEMPPVEEEAPEKIPSPKIASANTTNLRDIQNTLSFISGQVFSDEGEVRQETKRMVATEKTPFNYGAPQYRKHRGSDTEFKTAKTEAQDWKENNDYRINTPRPVRKPDGSVQWTTPEKPLFDTVQTTPPASPFNDAAPPQDQNNEDLKRMLDAYRNALLDSELPQEQFDNIVKRYQELLLKTRSQAPTGQETLRSTASSVKPSKQDTILESLQETIQDLQSQGEQDRAKRILDDVIVKKLDDSAKTYDVKSYEGTLKTFRGVHDSKEINVPQYYHSEFTKRDTSLKDTVQGIENLLDDSVLNALNEDFSENLSNAVSKLNEAAETLRVQVISLAEMRNLSPRELVLRALDEEQYSPQERFAAIQWLATLMEDSTTGVLIRPEKKQALLKFLNEYSTDLAQKQKDCKETGQTTLLLDETKLEELLTDVKNTKAHLEDPSSPKTSLASHRLEHVKELLVKIKTKVAAERASGKLTNKELQLCDEADAACNASLAAVDKSKNILATPAATGNVPSSTAEAKDQTSSLEIDDRKNQ